MTDDEREAIEAAAEAGWLSEPITSHLIFDDDHLIIEAWANQPVLLKCKSCGNWAKGSRTSSEIEDWLRVHHAASIEPAPGLDPSFLHSEVSDP